MKAKKALKTLNDYLSCFFCEVGPVSNKEIKREWHFFTRGGFAEVVCGNCLGRVDKDFKPMKLTDEEEESC